MTQEHPITPPQQLIDKWIAMLEYCDDIDVFTDVARWRADQELDGCCEWLDRNNQWARVDIDELRDGRRPKPQSLKEQALLAVDTAVADGRLSPDVSNVVRRALESLPD